MYGDVRLFRIKSGLGVEDISDEEVVELLTEADKIVLEDITRKVILEELTGDIDNSNKIFYTKHTPLADDDFDKSIGTSDVKVYAYYENPTTNERTLTELTVTSVDAKLGKITLSSAPQVSTTDKVLCTYRYYVSGKLPDWYLVKMASVYYACYLAYITEKGLLPVTFRLGSLAVSYGRGGVEKPHRLFLNLYLQTIEAIRGVAIGV